MQYPSLCYAKHKNANLNVPGQLFNGGKLEFPAGYAVESTTGSVFDAGCGNGHLSFQLLNQGWRWVGGVDMVSEQLLGAYLNKQAVRKHTTLLDENESRVGFALFELPSGGCNLGQHINALICFLPCHAMAHISLMSVALTPSATILILVEPNTDWDSFVCMTTAFGLEATELWRLSNVRMDGGKTTCMAVAVLMTSSLRARLLLRRTAQVWSLL